VPLVLGDSSILLGNALALAAAGRGLGRHYRPDQVFDVITTRPGLLLADIGRGASTPPGPDRQWVSANGSARDRLRDPHSR